MFIQTAIRKIRTRHHFCLALVLIVTLGCVSAYLRNHRPALAQKVPETKSIRSDNELLNNAEKNYSEAEALRGEQREQSNRKAVDLYKQASTHWRQVGNFKDAGEALRLAGKILQSLGEPHGALQCYRESLTLSRKTSDSIQEARVLNDLGYLFFFLGDNRAAHQSGAQALQLATQAKDQELEAQALSVIGEAYYGEGDLMKALSHQQRALNIRRALGNRRGQAQSLIALGYNYVHLAEPIKALESYEEARTISIESNDLRSQALALIAVGNLSVKLSEQQQALSSFHQAEELVKRIGDKISLASTLGGLGNSYSALGDYQKAVVYSTEALRLFELTNQRWGMAEAKLDLGRLYYSLDQPHKALELLGEALGLFHALGMPRLEAQTLREIGLVQSSMNELEKALISFTKSLQLTRSGQDQRHEAYTLNYLGQLYERRNRPAEALEYYHRALLLSRTAGDVAGEALTLCGIARVERNRNNLAEAEKNIEKATEIAESLRTKVAQQDLRASYLASVRETYELYIDILMLRHKTQLAGFDARAFDVSERARARSHLELLQEARANLREGVNSELLEEERLLKATLNAKAERQIQLLVKKDFAEAQKVAKEIDDLKISYNKLEDQIKTTSPRYAALALPQPLNLKEVQQRLLDDESILLEYALGEQRSYVWALTREGLSSYQLPSRREIEDSAMKFYKLTTAHQANVGESVAEWQRRKDQADEVATSETALLSKLVLGPLAGKLGHRRLIIVADGALQYIPFGALFDPDSPSDSPQRLIAKHEIVNQPSASTLAVVQAEAGTRKKASNVVAVLADPVFEIDDPRVRRGNNASDKPDKNLELRKALRDIGISVDGVEIPRLLASREEADGIVSVAPWGTGLKALGFDATRERVLGAEFANYRIIHFATHGLINNEHPELSGIVFSLYDETGNPQDGFLRLHDIYNLRLPADLVVLSACSTGLGKDVKGEGLIGLTRGFMYAGASGVVASLWKVDDEATAVLMKHFYDGLLARNLTPAAALRSAQLTMSQDKRWQSPYYWAGFVIQGQYNQRDLAPGYFSTQRRAAIIAAVILVSCLAALLLVTAIRRRRV